MSELVTVFRSMDSTAQQDCEILVDQLTAEGLHPVVMDDSAPGVPEGVLEVRVPADETEQAEDLIARNPLPDEVDNVDASQELDLETIYHSEGSPTGEIEAMAIQSVLEANGIAVVVVGDSVLPNMPFEVRVALEHAERAKELMLEAQKGGPLAAEVAEAATEAGGRVQSNEQPD